MTYKGFDQSAFIFRSLEYQDAYQRHSRTVHFIIHVYILYYRNQINCGNQTLENHKRNKPRIALRRCFSTVIQSSSKGTADSVQGHS
jgi:hypothetical protein